MHFSRTGLLAFALLSIAAATTVKFNILETTDTHAYQYGHSFMGLDATFSNYVSFVNQYVKKNPDTLVLDSGDITQGTAVSAYILPPGSAPLSTFFDIPNIISTVGNHDLNPGAADFIKYVSHASQTPWTNRMVTSNIRMKEDPSVPMGNVLWTTREIAGLKVAIVGVIYTEINGDRTFAHKPSSDSTCWDVDSDNVYVLWPNQTYNNYKISYTYKDEEGNDVSVDFDPSTNPSTNFPAWIAQEKPDLIISLSHIPTFVSYTPGADNILHPDLILNHQALRAVPGVEKIPIIFLTGHSHIWDESACKYTTSTGEKVDDSNCYIWNAEKYAEVFGIINLTFDQNSNGLQLINPETSRTRVNTSIELMEKVLGEPLVCDLDCQEMNITIASQVSRVDAWKFYGNLPNEWTHTVPYTNEYSIYNLWMKHFSPEVLKSEINIINGGNIRRGAYAGNNYFEDLVEIYPFADTVSKLDGLTAEVFYYIINGEVPPAGLDPKDYTYPLDTASKTSYYTYPPINTLEKGKVYSIVFDDYDTGIIATYCEKVGVTCTKTPVTYANGTVRQIRDDFYNWFQTTYATNCTHPEHLISASLPTYTAVSVSPSSKQPQPHTTTTKTIASSSISSSSSHYAHMTKGDIAATVIVLSIALACIGFAFGCCLGKKKSSSFA